MAVISFFEKRNKRNILYRLTPFLLLLDLVLGNYSKVILQEEFIPATARNWLFTGIPYVCIGMYIKEHLEKIENYLKDNGRVKLIVSIVISCILTMLMRLELVINNRLVVREHYLTTTTLAIAVFLYYLFYVNQNENLSSRIGNRYSTWIYILHPILVNVLEFLPMTIKGNIIYMYLNPILVFVVMIILVALFTERKAKAKL